MTNVAHRLEALTAAELDLLRLVGRGLSHREIGDALSIGERAATARVRRLVAKLGLRDRAQAVVVAYESRMVDTGGGRDGPTPG